jgi:acyl-CoA reductase-like NAD-dependent aldehyde dehydrogenase
MGVRIAANLIGGVMSVSAAHGTIDVLNPVDERQIVGAVPAMGTADVANVYNAAQAAVRDWRADGPIARGEVLARVASSLRARAAEFAELIVREMGKTILEAQAEVLKSADFFEYYAGLSRLPFGELLPDVRAGSYASVSREPLGVVLLITPWNDPLLTPARKLAPALLAGNCAVLKPPMESPLSALLLAEVMQEAGLRAGVVNTITGQTGAIGKALIEQPFLRALSFTGSTAVGLSLQAALAGKQVRVQTEMGGKNAAVVLADADLDMTLATVMSGAFAAAGQRCTATSRLVVVTDVAQEVTERIAAAADALAIGSGLDPTTEMGPVVSRSHRDAVVNHVDRAVADGAELLAGGTTPAADAYAYGAFVRPAVLRTKPDSALWREEVFGPVLSVFEVRDEQAAIAAVNDSAYGLSSAVYTSDLGAATRFIDQAETGQVSVNLPTSGWDVHQPFGGFRNSGSAFKEQGTEALSFYTRTKTAAVRFQW